MQATQIPVGPPPDFKILDLLKKAWSLIVGIKLPMWAVYLAYGVAIAAAFSLVFLASSTILTDEQSGNRYIDQVILYVEMVMKVILAPLACGAFMIAIKRTRGENPTIKSGFRYFNKWIALAMTMLFIVIVQLILREGTRFLQGMVGGAVAQEILALGYLLSYLGLIYLTIFALPLVADKNLNPWEAIKTSASVIKARWLKFLGLIAFLMLVWWAVALPLFISTWWIIVLMIAAIWLLPFTIMSLSLAYRVLVDKLPV